MVVSDKYKFVYFDVPKTGSRSAQDTLREIDKNARIIYTGRIPSGQFLGKNMHVHSRAVPAAAKNYTKIVTVRHPYDWIVSYFYFYKQRKLSPELHTIDKFIDYCIRCVEEHPSNTKDIAIYRHFPVWKYMEPFGYDIFLKLEDINNEVINKLSFYPKNKKWRKDNINDRKPPTKEVLTDELKIKIQRWAGKDFELFGYER